MSSLDDPITMRQRLLAWYGLHQRRLPWRETTDPYAIWVSEVMLQQTQVAAAIPYYLRFLRRFPGPAELAGSDIQEVLKLWEGLGYYSRARNLHRAAGLVVSRFGGRVPDDPQAFQSLPGVGDYIAAAVMSIAFNHVLAVVDGNVKRVLARLLEMDTPVNHSRAHKDFMKPAARLICPQQPAAYNQALMELGALVCRPATPLCDACPLADVCLARRNGTTAAYPKRLAARKVPHRHLIVGIILKKKKLLVLRRPADGMLGGMWEFPAVSASLKKAAFQTVAKALASQTGLSVDVDRHLSRIRHAYSHFTLSADVYLCRHTAGRMRPQRAGSHRWLTRRALDGLPMHKAARKCLNAALAALDKMGSDQKE
jgi:A/G-specific adenine glycosylase